MSKKKLLIMEMIVGVKKNFYANIKELKNYNLYYYLFYYLFISNFLFNNTIKLSVNLKIN